MRTAKKTSYQCFGDVGEPFSFQKRTREAKRISIFLLSFRRILVEEIEHSKMAPVINHESKGNQEKRIPFEYL